MRYVLGAVVAFLVLLFVVAMATTVTGPGLGLVAAFVVLVTVAVAFVRHVRA